MSAPPRVDVVVLTWNDEPLLEQAVASVLASERVDARVVVVDNGSAPPATVHADRRVALVRNTRNVGVAPGRNQGVRATTAPYVCVLDSDARLDPHCLRTMVDVAEAASDVGIVVPVYNGQDASHTAGRAPTFGRKLLRVANLSARYRAADDPVAAQWEVDFGIGACQLVRRQAFDEVGGLEEDYFYGPEDVDFCLRVRRAGWRVVQVRAARCDHPPRRRNRRLFTRRGLAHARAVARHLLRHRDFAKATR